MAVFVVLGYELVDKFRLFSYYNWVINNLILLYVMDNSNIIKIGDDWYVAKIGGFSDELRRGFDPGTGVYIGMGINPEELYSNNISPFEDCVVSPIENPPTSFYRKLEDYSFQVIPLNESFPESFGLSEEGGVVLPTIFKNRKLGIVEGKAVNLKFTYHRLF